MNRFFLDDLPERPGEFVLRERFLEESPAAFLEDLFRLVVKTVTACEENLDELVKKTKSILFRTAKEKAPQPRRPNREDKAY